MSYWPGSVNTYLQELGRAIRSKCESDGRDLGAVLWDCEPTTFIPTYSAMGLQTPKRPVDKADSPFKGLPGKEALAIASANLIHQAVTPEAVNMILSYLP